MSDTVVIRSDLKDRNTPPEQAIDQPIFWEPSLAFLRYAIGCIFGGSAAALIAILVLVPDQLSRAVNPLAPVLVAAIAWFCLARGRIEAAVRVLAYGFWITLTCVSWFNGGADSTIVIIYPMIILMCGWLIGTGAAMTVALLTLITTLGFVLAEYQGILPTPPPTPPALRWAVQSMVFLFSVFLIVYVVRSYRNRLEELRVLGDKLVSHTAMLEERETELNRAQAVAHVGSWVYEIGVDSMRLSNETCRIFGLPEGTTGSRSAYLARVHEEDRNQVDAAWQAALAGGAPFDSEHRIVVGKSVRWVRQIAELDFGTGEKPLRALGTTQDITGHKQDEEARALLEAQLRESQKLEALGTLAGGIAHDFNNILAAIIGNVELARLETGPNHAMGKSLEQIGEASRRGKALVQQILIYCRRQMLPKNPMSLFTVIAESERLLRVMLPPGVSLSVECQPDLHAIMGDATRIQQALLNLCTNAAQAIKGVQRPGTIEVRLRELNVTSQTYQGPERRIQGERAVLAPGRYVCLGVRDDGPGIDDATRARMFEPFFTTKPMGEGTGLGLSVVQGIVQSHDAIIEVQSTPGKGAAFRIYFPALDQLAQTVTAPGLQSQPRLDPETTGVKETGTSLTEGSGKHILYVDDDKFIVFLMTRLLERRGYRVSGHSDPLQALAEVRADPARFSLVVTDYNMPEMSGLEVTRLMHGIRADLPVAIASGYITEELQAAAPAAGVSELIFKADVEDLCAAVTRLARGQRR